MRIFNNYTEYQQFRKLLGNQMDRRRAKPCRAQNLFFNVLGGEVEGFLAMSLYKGKVSSKHIAIVYNKSPRYMTGYPPLFHPLRERKGHYL